MGLKNQNNCPSVDYKYRYGLFLRRATVPDTQYQLALKMVSFSNQ